MDKEKKAGGYDYLKAENARLKEETINLIAELKLIREPGTGDSKTVLVQYRPVGHNVADLRFTFMDIVREVDFRGAPTGDFKFTEAYVNRN